MTVHGLKVIYLPHVCSYTKIMYIHTWLNKIMDLLLVLQRYEMKMMNSVYKMQDCAKQACPYTNILCMYTHEALNASVHAI